VTILVLGAGAREHALAATLGAEAGVRHVLCAPGNAGMAAIGRTAAVDLSQPGAVLALARSEGVALTVVGPELPLSVGVVDLFRGAGEPIVGPTRAAARLETSKGWAKSFMARHGVPTAPFEITDDEETAIDIVRSGRLGWPLVIKADGLAAGKGVVLADAEPEAIATVRDMMSGRRFGEAGARVVLEACLRGPELSYFVLTDGKTAVALGTAQDHKRAFDDDQGPNTGGMGAFAPSPMVDDALNARVLAEIVEPVLAGMREEGHPYTGFLYCGLMLTAEGPMVIEFNARLGDPEAQVLLPLGGPLLPLLQGAASGSLDGRHPRLPAARRVGVVVASRGYPDTFETGHEIEGLADAAALPDVRVYHAGTRRNDGRTVTSGGRVLTVVGSGSDFPSAIAHAYAGVDKIHFKGAFARRDIGRKALASNRRPTL
jgi:phosphoribosylamine--glycine ligase